MELKDDVVIGSAGNTTKSIEKLFNKNFILLWQGHFVSIFGDVVYGIALGFWVLKATGSTALMGTLMAASVLPTVLVSPFAGVIVDRSNKKRLMIMMDIIRGILITLVSIAAFKGILAVWMVFVTGMILSTCGAFFQPTANAVLPDIVPKAKLTNANAIFGMVMTGANILGNSVGGFLYQLAGAPLVFLLNALSFIFSGASIAASDISTKKGVKKEQHFFEDMKEGFSFVWQLKGLRYSLTMIAFLNFFAFVGIVLILPLFQRTSGLGAAKYGIAMAFFSGGMFLGMLVTSVIKIPPKKRMLIYMLTSLLSSLFFAAFPLIGSFPLVCILILVGGMLNSICNVLIMSSIQASTPEHTRGKVFSLLSMISQGLTPIGMAVGGVLGQFLPIPLVMSASFIICFILFVPFAFSRDFARFINFDPETQVLEDII